MTIEDSKQFILLIMLAVVVFMMHQNLVLLSHLISHYLILWTWNVYISSLPKPDSLSRSGVYGPVRTVLTRYQTVHETPIKVEFLAFHLEEDGLDCDFDYVIFYDGDSKNSEILAGPLCGPALTFIPEIYSTTEYLTMEFVSDESTAEGGFQATYEQMDGTPCGESLFRPSGKKQFQSALALNRSSIYFSFFFISLENSLVNPQIQV